MMLKPIGLIATRWHVEKLAEQYPDVTEIDLSDAEVAGGSTMHQFLLSFPNATITGLEGWNKTEYEWVVKSINIEEFKRNQARAMHDPHTIDQAHDKDGA